MINTFYLTATATVLVTRSLLWVWRLESPTIGTLKLHHYMYGAATALLAAVLFHSLLLYAIGWGLVVDEAVFVVTGGKTYREYFSAVSIVGTMLLIAVLYSTRLSLLTSTMR